MKRKDFIEEWLKALESGEYQQTTGVLKAELQNGQHAYCCLGVACEVANKTKARKVNVSVDNDQVLPSNMTSLLGISENGSFVVSIVFEGREFSCLAEMNDYGVDFKEIAQIIREQIAAGNMETP